MSKDLLFFLTEKDGRVRQKKNGVVTSLGTRRALPQAPIGSREISIGWERSMEWWGNIRNFSLPLGFVMDGADIIRNDAYKFNVDRELYLLILRFVSEIDAVYYKDYYKYLYKGQLDFSSIEDKQGDSVVQINIMEGGLNKILKSQSIIQFDIELDDDAIDVYFDGVLFDISAKYLNPEVLNVGSLGPHGSSNYILPISIINSEGTVPGSAFLSSGFENINITGPTSLAEYLANSTNFFYYTAKARDINIKGSIKADFGATQGVDFNLRDNYNNLLWTSGHGNSYTGVTEIPFDVNLSLADDTKLFFHVFDTLGNTIDYLDSNIEITFKNRADPTTVKMFTPFVLYKKLCLKMGVKENQIISEALQACTFCVTSGDGLRGLDGAKVKTRFGDFFKAFSIYLMAGVAVENDKLVFEKFEHFFVQDSVLSATELGEAKDFTIKDATDLLFSSIKVGHAEQQIDDVNGKDDFNGYYIFSSPQKTVTKELDLQSPYKAGPIEEEIKRLNLEGKKTTDDSSDNDVYVADVITNLPDIFNVNMSFVQEGNFISLFALTPRLVAGAKFIITGSVNNNTTYTVTRSQRISNAQVIYTDITITNAEFNVPVTLEILEGKVYELDRSIVVTSGVHSPETIFNVRLSPKRILETWYPWIKSFLRKFDGEKLIFQSANRNADLVAGGITEKADVDINSMGDPIAMPFYIEHGTQVPISLVDTLESTPNRCFATIWKDVRYTGFLWSAALAPVTRGEQTYRHLMTAENDPEDLI